MREPHSFVIWRVHRNELLILCWLIVKIKMMLGMMMLSTINYIDLLRFLKLIQKMLLIQWRRLRIWESCINRKHSLKMRRSMQREIVEFCVFWNLLYRGLVQVLIIIVLLSRWSSDARMANSELIKDSFLQAFDILFGQSFVHHWGSRYFTRALIDFDDMFRCAVIDFKILCRFLNCESFIIYCLD